MLEPSSRSLYGCQLQWDLLASTSILVVAIPQQNPRPLSFTIGKFLSILKEVFEFYQNHNLVFAMVPVVELKIKPIADDPLDSKLFFLSQLQ
jgi:hypothetical protein